jgi:acyl-CoA synthetase (AMP-forming)/AMP-acid ligase II
MDVLALTPQATAAEARALATHHIAAGHRLVIKETRDWFLCCRTCATTFGPRTCATLVGALRIAIVAVATHRTQLAEAIVIVIDAYRPRIYAGRICAD